MTLNVDWFSIFGQNQGVSGASGGVGGFPGTIPDKEYHRAPWYTEMLANVNFTFMLPQAANISQVIVSHWPWNENTNASATDFLLLVEGSPKATKTWTSADRKNDRGSVWDLNRAALRGDELNFRFRTWRGPNQNNRAFQCSLTGTWLRDP